MLRFDRKQQNSVKQFSYNKKKKNKFKKKKKDFTFQCRGYGFEPWSGN